LPSHWPISDYNAVRKLTRAARVGFNVCDVTSSFVKLKIDPLFDGRSTVVH